MVQFYVGNTMIALVDKPNWVRVLSNGVYGLCEYADAEGVAINGTVYNLTGFDIGGVDEVSFKETDIGTVLNEMASYAELAAAIREGVNAV